jgi:hypothetical protein
MAEAFLVDAQGSQLARGMPRPKLQHPQIMHIF